MCVIAHVWNVDRFDHTLSTSADIIFIFIVQLLNRMERKLAISSQLVNGQW